MKRRSRANYGIQARDIKAGALAVGEHARATATVAPHRDDALEKLADAVRQLKLAGARQAPILEHVESMKQASAPGHAATFGKIVSALTEVGHIAELVGPLKAVAAAFGLPAAF